MITAEKLRKVAELLQESDALRHDSITAVIGRGGDISPNAGYIDLPRAIYNIPADNAITTVTYNEVSLGHSVPSNTTGYAYIAEFGGISRRREIDIDGTAIIENEVFEGVVSFDAEWNNVEEEGTFWVPPEILALEGYGDGIDIDHYNKVALVNQKYKRVIETFTFGGEGDTKIDEWKLIGVDGTPTKYYRIKVAGAGTYETDIILCDRHESAIVTSNTTNIGVGFINSDSGYVALRPENVMDFTTPSFKKWLLANPITVKVARTVPIETDLPVYMNPLIKVVPNGFLDIYPTTGAGVPNKIIHQTYTQ